MPPKIKFSKETIVDTALAIAKEKGLAFVTARSVAKKMNSSVAPIYVNFETIDDLVDAVVHRVFAISEELFRNQKGENNFENMGRASIAFARKYPILFRELSLQPNPYLQAYEVIEEKMIEALSQDEELKDWSTKELKLLLLKLRVFQMGLAVMVANGQIPTWLNENDFDKLLMEVGDDVLFAHKQRRK